MIAANSTGHCASSAFLGTVCFCVLVVFSHQLYAQESARKLIVGTERGFYPFADVDDRDRPQGFSVDLFRATAREMNIDFEFRIGTWAEILQAIEDKEIDVLPFVKYTERRDGFLDFSITHVVEHAIVLKRVETRSVNFPSDLAGKDVVVMKSDGPHLYLDSYVPEAQLSLAPTTSDALLGLADGLYDYAVVARTVGLVKMRDLKLEKRLQRTGPLLEVYDRGFSFAVQDGNSELLATLNQGLNLVKESGEYNEIYNQWFGDIDPRASGEKFQRQIIYVVAAVLAVALIVGIWLTTLRRLVVQQAREVQLRREATEAERTANLELQKQNERLAAYDHTIAHSLKTPLSATGRFLEILVKFKGDTLSDEQRRLGTQALTTLQHGEQAVDALLKLSTVSQEQVEQEPLDMGELVKEALRQLADEQANAQARVKLPTDWPVVWGYAPWVGEIWLNYLSNALKYSGTPAHLELGSIPADDGYIRFWVRDSGRPLSGEEREQLFTPFTRLQPEQVSGHGLGLTIVKRIIEKLGGSAGVSSLQEYGNEFYFTLRLCDEYPRSDTGTEIST